MFEKEADFAETKMLVECKGDYSKKKDYKKGWQEGATFGYNKANEWHNIRENPNDLPTDNSSLYYVLVYSWDFGLSHLYSKYGTYIPTVCEWDGEHFEALDRGAYTNARNIRSCFAWKEIVPPNIKEIKEK